MSRRTLFSLVGLMLGLAATAWGTVVLIRRDRLETTQRFAEERHRVLFDAAHQIEDDIEDIGEDLRLAAEFASSHEPATFSRELRAVLEAVGQYKALAAFGEAGQREVFLVDRRSAGTFDVRGGEALMASTAALALAGKVGVVHPSEPTPERPWFRAFALAWGDHAPRGAVASLVDLEPLFTPLKLLAAEPQVRLLLVGPHGRVAPLSTAPVPPEDGRGPLQVALADARAGRSGRLLLSEPEAAQVGLPGSPAVAVFAPIRVRDASRWYVVVFASTATLGAVERATTVRFSLAGAVVGALFLAFAASMVATARREAALEESRRHAERLAHLHDRAQKVLDNVPAGVLALDHQLRISVVNAALRSRLGAEVAGKALAEALPAAPPAVVQQVSDAAQAAAERGLVHEVQDLLPLFGEERHFRVRAVPLEAPSAEVAVLVVVEDLSDLRSLESQLLRAEKLVTVGVLSAGIAHELGTPLGVVRGRAEYLQTKLGRDHPAAAGIQVIVDQVDLVSRTIRQLLDFARLQPPAVRAVEAHGIGGALEELLSLEAQRRQLSLSVELDPATPQLAADADQLQQALVNLVVNACDACPAGGAVRVRIAPADSARWVVIEVSDTGAGISEENLGRIFDPFFTTKKRGQGTGLGLAVVAQILRNHGARIEVESAPGRGTRMTVYWPASATESHAA